MTTPRVTVPVEPTQEMLVAGARAVGDFYSCGGPYPRAKAMYRAMLSAAPAPEGGAVKKACVDFQEAIDDFEAEVADVMAEGSERADLWDREITVNIDALKTVMSAALATREEAPAEAGENWPALADLHTIRGWLYGLSAAPDLTDVVADGGVSIGDCYQQEAREFAGRIERIINVLRAQPPAHEDARACYDCATDRPHRTSEACTHPASDALRVAVEQTPDAPWIDCVQKMLDRFDRAKGKGGYPTANEREAMRRCMIPVHLLAALQAEQKGGA